MPKLPSKILSQSSGRTIRSRRTWPRFTLCPLLSHSWVHSPFAAPSMYTSYSTNRHSQFGMCLLKLSSNGTQYIFRNIYPFQKATKITKTIIPSVMRE